MLQFSGFVIATFVIATLKVFVFGGLVGWL